MIVFHLFFIKLLIGTVLHLTAPGHSFRSLLHPALFFRRAVVRARIAPDGQWRFPPADSLPGKFVTCLLTYEDKRFFRHSGVDPVADRPSHADQPQPGQGRQRGEHDHHATGTDRAGQPRPYPV